MLSACMPVDPHDMSTSMHVADDIRSIVRVIANTAKAATASAGCSGTASLH